MILTPLRLRIRIGFLLACRSLWELWKSRRQFDFFCNASLFWAAKAKSKSRQVDCAVESVPQVIVCLELFITVQYDGVYIFTYKLKFMSSSYYNCLNVEKRKVISLWQSFDQMQIASNLRKLYYIFSGAVQPTL